MAPRLVPRPRYLLLLAFMYGAVGCAFAAAFFLGVALIARPGLTVLFFSGVITGGLIALGILLDGGRSIKSLRHWSRRAHPTQPFDHQSV